MPQRAELGINRSGGCLGLYFRPTRDAPCDCRPQIFEREDPEKAVIQSQACSPPDSTSAIFGLYRRKSRLLTGLYYLKLIIESKHFK